MKTYQQRMCLNGRRDKKLVCTDLGERCDKGKSDDEEKSTCSHGVVLSSYDRLPVKNTSVR